MMSASPQDLESLREQVKALGAELDETYRGVTILTNELHAAAQALAAERDKLEKTVELRTKDLRRSLDRVEEANHAKSRFLSSMSHELRTPLNAILGFTDVLTMKARGPLNEKQLHFVQRINQGGKHLLALITDLLDMAKIDAGAMEVVWETFTPSECIDSVVGMMTTQFQKKDLEVNVYVDPDSPALYGDILKAKQIMLNLLSNAVKYTPEHGRIDVQAIQESEDRVRISVSDTGIGIEPEQTLEVFSEFHQIDHVRDEALGGIGLGLALTRRLVELHGGAIGVESQPGKGSTFWFTFPLSTREREARTPEVNGVEGLTPIPSGHRILVVEDMQVNLEVILEMLDGHNHEVAVARDGQQAIELAKSFGPELILMDIKMPVMDGFEATRRLRAMPQFAETPIIALTASAGPDVKKRCRAAGCTAHLAKPIESESLYAALQEHLPTSAQKEQSI